MQLNIVKIGNSQGIRIPKTLLSQTGLGGTVNVAVKDDTIIISAPVESAPTPLDSTKLSQAALAKTWDDPREDAAWAHL